MKMDCLVACGIVWYQTANPDAGWELVEALESAESQVRVLAQVLLVDGGEYSLRLLESALAAGAVSPEAAGPCMAEIFRKLRIGPVVRQRPMNQRELDASLC